MVTAQGQGRTLRILSTVVLTIVAAVGAVLSYASLYDAATVAFPAPLAAGFPLLVDALILGSAARYVASARVGRPRAGWRLTAHAGAAGTIALNALASESWAGVPWHVTAPVVWSVLVELTARDVLGEWRAQHRPMADAIPVRLWLTAPVESGRVWLRMARRLDGEQAAARLDVGAHQAAAAALRLALTGRGARQTRRILGRQLRAGTLSPDAVLAACQWQGTAGTRPVPLDVLRDALGASLTVTAGGTLSDPVDDRDLVDDQALVVSHISAGQERAREQELRLDHAPVVEVDEQGRVEQGRQAPVADDEVLDMIDRLVEQGQLDPAAVTGNRLRGLASVGTRRARRLADAWHERHRRASLAAL